METTQLTKIGHDEKLDSEQLLTKLQTLQGYLEQQRLLHDISLLLSEIEDTDSFYQQVIKLARTELGFDRLGLFLLNKSQTVLTGTYGIDPGGELRKENDIVIELAESERLDQLFSNKQRMLVVEDTDLFDNNEVAGRGWQITVPLWQENKPLGVIFADNLFTQKPLRPFEPNILSDYADTITNRISRMRAKEALRQSEQALQISLEMQNTLHEINLELATINDLDELTRQTIILGREKLGFERLGLWLIDDAKETMYGTYGVGPDGELRSEQGDAFIIEDEDWIQDFVYQKERMTVREDDELFEGTEGEQIGRGWHIIAALWAHGSPVGLFFADNFLSKEPLQPYQPELLSAYGANIATLIYRMQTEKALKESEQSMQTFLEKMQDLHEIGLHLSTIDDEQEMLRQAFTLASAKLGFSRLGLFLLDSSQEHLTGTLGIGADGQLRDEFHIVHNLEDEPWMRDFLFGKERLSLHEDTDLYEEDKIIGRGWNIVAALWIEDEPLGLLFTDNLLSQEPLKPYHPELLSTFGSTIANLIYQNRIDLERESTQAAIAKQAADLQTVADLSTQITTIQDPQVLMDTIVQEAKARFDLYHTQIYLLDEPNNKLVLAAGAGEAGKIMVDSGYHIQLNQQNSLVARTARTQQGVVVNNVMMDPEFLPSPLLPETCSEMAVPMVVGDQVLGVFDVQANVTDRFSNEDVQIQMTLAAQIAVALQNARQYEQTQQALANAAIFRQLIDSANQGVHLTDLNGASIYVNPAFLKLHHHQFKNLEEELYGKELTPFYPEDIQARYNQEIIPTMLEKGSWEGELQFGDPENPTITYETYFLLNDKDGNVTNSAVIVSDITELKEREETIRANRNLMRSIIDASPDWIIVKSRDNRYMLVNQAFSDYNGIPVEDMVGKDDIEIGFDEELVRGNPEKGIPGFWPEDQAVMDSGEVFQKDDLLEDFDQVRYNSTVKTPLKDEDGNVIGLIVFVHDITPQKTAEIAMAKRAEELQTVAELSTAVAATSDPQQLLQDVVDQTKERFDLYHAHIYLLDDSGKNLVLAKGAGDAGATMVKEGFSIPLDQEKSLVARAARSRKGIIVDDVTADPGFLPNELLPDTRSEMAVPMIVGNEVLGVLDVQSTEVNGFSSEDVQIQSTLAAQIAVSLQNARQYEQTQQALANAAIFRQLIDSASQGVHLTDLNGATIYANPAFLKLHHLPFKNLEDLYGKELISFYPEDVQASYNQEIIPAIREHGSWEGELQLGDPENPTITYENYFLLHDKDGNVTHSAIIVSDITELREREEAIRANQNLMRTIIDATPDWIIVKSRENSYLMVNEAFAKTRGMTADEMVGKNDLDVGYDEELVRGNPEKGIEGFWEADQAVMDAGVEVTFDGTSHDDEGNLHFNTVRKIPLKAKDGSVSGLVMFIQDITAQKTAELTMAKRAEELQTVAELSTTVAATSDQQQLLQDVVDQTKERFDLYHAHIYLLDDSGRNLVLAAGAGDAGATMVKEGFSIPLDQEKSLVARAARSRKGVIVDDVTADPGFLPNKLLPDTRSEMAVPMIVGDNVLGVLDVQSTQVEGFSSENVQIQSTLASQIAVALQNVRSLERSQQVVEELDALTRRLTRESWEEYLTAAEKEDMAFVYHLGELTTVENIDTGELEPETAVTPTNGHFSQSLLVHGEPIGHLTVFNDEESDQIGEDAALIMAAVAEQLSARVENIRLTEQTEFALAQTQEQAQRLGLLNEISAEMSNVETLNQVFNVIFERIPSLLKVDQVSLTMLQPDGETLELIGYEGVEMEMPIGTKIPLADTPMAKALHDNRVIANNESSSDNTIQSSMIAPIYSSGRAIGTLNIGSVKTSALTNREETLLQQLATMLSSVIENKQLLAAAQARAERERQVRTITDKIRRGVDREAILNIAQQEIGKLIGAKQSAAQLGTKTQLLERIQQTIEQTKQKSD